MFPNKEVAVVFILVIVGARCQEKVKFAEWQENTLKTLDEDVEEYSKSTRTVNPSYFNVQFESEPIPISVHTLRPQDIDVVGAMGDSITAGVGADGGQIGEEARGNVFSVGGNGVVEEMLTLPNILKKFNRFVDGYSVGINAPVYDHGFNVGVSGARAYHMPEQADELIRRLKNDNRTDYERDWKLITMFIGGNDLCAIGRDPEGTTAEVYVAGIQESLDILHAEVPRMFVNIVDIMEIYVLPEIGQGDGATPLCRLLQKTFCGYVATAGEDDMQKIKEINWEYQIQLEELINSGRYDTRDDFTVVIQPFLRDTVLPYTEDGEVDTSFFAMDCFHFSELAHGIGASNLFNNMLEPVGQKSTVWSYNNIKVPTEEHPYFFTSKNSAVVEEPVCPEVEEVKATPLWAYISIGSLLLVDFIGLIVIIGFCSSRKKRNKVIVEDQNEADTIKNEAL